MRFHVYRKDWERKVGEIMKTPMEPENMEEKYNVAVLDKNVSYFLRAPAENTPRLYSSFSALISKILCSEVKGKTNNSGDGKGMRVPCNLTLKGNGNG